MTDRPRRKRDILKRLKLFTCPHCGLLVGCDENGRLGMYSLKIRNRHVQSCEKAAAKAQASPGEDS